MNIKSIEEAPFFKHLNRFADMMNKTREIAAINDPDAVDNSDERTQEDYGDGDLREKVN